MKKRGLHHPDFSFPVTRRGITEELLAMVEGYTAAPHNLLSWRHAFPERAGYRAAMYRLRKKGLIAYVNGGRHQVLRITAAGKKRLPAYLRPEKEWNRKWGGYWYVLMYDVPEQHRENRYALRKFLERLQMGCLQKSVWVTPDDIRPDYHDLEQAASISNYAVLLEAQTVLGYKDAEIARRAWDFEEIEEAQGAYLRAYEQHLDRITTEQIAPPELEQIGREEMQAYASVMSRDPLLPEALHPVGYLGIDAYRLHQKIVQAIGTALV